MNKTVRRIIVALYCVYTVCSFLPSSFILPNGYEILGSQFLFAILDGTGFSPAWKISLTYLVLILLGLFITMLFSKKKFTVKYNIVVNACFSFVYILSLITGVGRGSGVEICLVISSLILIINIFLMVLLDNSSSKKRTKKAAPSTANKKPVSKSTITVKSEQKKAESYGGAKLCPNCGKLLFANEICDCARKKESSDSPVKIRKCSYCGKMLFGNEVCSCRAKK